MRLAGFAFLLLAASAGEAFAQARPPSDPIARLLNPGAQPVDEDTAERTGAAPVEPEPERALPDIPTGPAKPSPGAIGVEQTGKTAEPTPSLRDMAYDNRLRASFAAAESFQGPMDGGWTVSAPGKGDLYSLQLVDRRERIEGAWRDLHRKGAGSVGLIDQVARTGEGVTLTFTPEGQPPVTVALQGAGRTLSGELDTAGGRTPVTLRRTGP